MKLFCKEEMRLLEEKACEAGASLEGLMEQAGLALAEEAESRCRPLAGKRVVLLCGKGNNGGDGFVCARRLSQLGARCMVLLVQGQPKTGLALGAYQAMPGTVERLDCQVQREEGEKALSQAQLIIDCVFGFSFRGELSGTAAAFLALANRRDCFKLAADLPSGAECGTARLSPGAFQAHVTVTFTAKKPANCSYPAKEACGETVVRQVGVPPLLTERAETEILETDGAFCRQYLQEPGPQSNKGDLGKLLLVCGSYGMAGACVMAAKAALRCGVGLLRVAVDRSIYPIVAQAVPEAVFLPLDWDGSPEESGKKLEAALAGSTACLVGCGLGDLAELLCPQVFSHCAVPLAVDADALNFCARHPEALKSVKAPFILTPHPGEMSRLCGKPISEIQGDRLEIAREKARETGAVVALKGAATVIAGPDGRCAVNPTGNAGMAKGGSGDVLAGMVGSFLAQGVPPFQAAAVGAYLHGLAGDLVARRLGKRSLLPTDLIEALPQAFQALQDGESLIK